MPAEDAVDGAYRCQRHLRLRLEAQIAALARRQHGIVTRAQLARIGLNHDQIDRRVAALRLFVVHRGVYAVGPGPLAPEGRWLAAVRAVEPDALLSHRPAAVKLRLLAWEGGDIDITSSRVLRPRDGLRIHRAHVPTDERWVRDGIPLTSPARTILDLAATLSKREVERLITEAHVNRLPLRPPLVILLDRYPGRRGSATLRAALAAFEETPAYTRSEFEERFLDFLDRHGLPRPLVNARVETHIGALEVDFLWSRERVVIELDGFASHGLRPAFRNDRRRDRALRLAGRSPSRLVWEDLDDEAALDHEIRCLLVAGGA